MNDKLIHVRPRRKLKKLNINATTDKEPTPFQNRIKITLLTNSKKMLK